MFIFPAFFLNYYCFEIEQATSLPCRPRQYAHFPSSSHLSPYVEGGFYQNDSQHYYYSAWLNLWKVTSLSDLESVQLLM